MRNFYFYLLFLSLSFHSLSAQNPQQSLLKTLQEFHSIPKEVAYLHLNKTVLLQGEQLGFSAYLVKKSDLTPSKATSNLYVQVKNESGEVVKQKLLLVEEGVASNVIAIDTSFASGEYTITAFTNWMRNFEEQNYFTESFRVISSNLDHVQQKEEVGPDVQFLPESGHLLSNAINTVGVVVKDKSGYGLSNATLMINDGSKVINKISLNRFGIGRFTLIPEYGKKYSAVLFYQGKEIPVAFNTPIVSEGIILSAVQRNKELRLLVSTNAATSAKIKNQPYFLVVQNRGLVEAHELRFGDKENIPVILDLDYLESGINIFTLVDENRQPIAERLFFNYECLPVKGMKEPQIIAVKDSLQVKFSTQEPDSTRISVSILPQQTLSYNRNHSIVSYNLLQPYVKGTIEEGSWYFTDITEEKKYELDNLLLTQGWSSYNWESIFNFEEKLPYPFEEGVVLKGIMNTRDSRRNELKYMIHATENSNPMVLEIPSDKDAFIVDGFQPVEGEQLFISRVKNNDKLLPAGLSVQFYPSAIPFFRPGSNILPQRPLVSSAANNNFIAVRAFENPGEELREVLLETKIDRVRERERKLGAHSYGQVHVVKDNDIPLYHTLGGYLSSKGLGVSEGGGNFKVVHSLSALALFSDPNSEPDPEAPPAPILGSSDGGMAIFLDGVPIMDQNMFYQYPLASIDYIEINKTGMGNGFMGSKGSIKIYSSLQSRYSSRDRTRIQQFDIPLAYSSEKQYYVPKYENDNDSFFISYGVIDWIPSLSSEGGEELSFRIKKPEVDFQMIIEGFTADGTLIYDVKTVSAGE
ncbi:hypothetical protein [Salinimicrobium xinjiangense]|uniref:hypothetical protein n=1 Tax=Salinimicrobium xinjiangense TaxID=438596 RepID=UPI000418B942|nr:hypothetical protein [Salinimicrobium xinjiangense]